MVTAELYILYGFLAFICLLQVAIVVILVRQSAAIGRLEGLIPRVEKLELDVGNLRDQMNEQIGSLREQMNEQIGSLREQMNEQIGNLREQMNEQIGNLREHMNEQIGSLRDQMNEQISGLRDHMNEQIGNLRDQTGEQIGSLRDQVGNLREQVAELKGILLGVNDRIDLLRRHRHDGAGRVVIVPEEAGVAAD